MFAQRLAGHSRARIARALNEAGIPCPSAADPGRNPHRTGTAWTLGTVTTILGNPRYTGRQVWNRQRTDSELADPANTSLGHTSVQRWTCPTGGSSPPGPPTRPWSARPTSLPRRTSAPPAARRPKPT
jgi:site-specific DNA recombinase